MSVFNLIMCYLVVKDVFINPTNTKELEVNELTMLFNNPSKYWVGTTINPTIPPGISRMFAFFFFHNYCFLFVIIVTYFFYIFFFL
jgi:hypothetical protein